MLNWASKFRTSMTSVAGHGPAKICQGRIVNINLLKWTVDVIAQFDRKRYFNIQVSSPYLHHASGEGIYVMPEVNATVMVCIPSDSTAPFVLGFIMPTETVDSSTDDAPLGTTQHAQAPANATDSSYAAGRTANPGDIVMRSRDNNFVILHRGGVLQVGATPLAQRLYIPLQNLVMDISENYEHQNSGGAIKWGIQEGPSQTTHPTQFVQTFRVFAENQYADVRVTCGDITGPYGDPDGGVAAAADGLGQKNNTATASNCVLFEIAVTPQGFNVSTGVPNDVPVSASTFRFAYDRTGNVFLRNAGNFSQQTQGKYTLSVVGDLSVSSQGVVELTSPKSVKINGGKETDIIGTVVRLNAGKNAVASKGDMVRIDVATTTPLQVGPTPIPVVGSPTGPWSIAPGTPIILTGTLWGSIVVCQNSSVLT
jgi:hypothetical protein